MSDSGYQPGTDVSTHLGGLEARASRAHARPKPIGVPVQGVARGGDDIVGATAAVGGGLSK